MTLPARLQVRFLLPGGMRPGIRKWLILLVCVCATLPGAAVAQTDSIAQLQLKAASTAKSDWGHWGPDASLYASWSTHSNRLIPVYTFGIDLAAVAEARTVPIGMPTD